MIPFNKDQAAKLRAANTDPGSPMSTSTSPSGKGQGQKQPCKFWLTDEGCRRGAGCKYGHVFQTKEDKKARCWTCGATTHRQCECPTRSGGKKGKKDGGGSGPKAGTTSSTTSTNPVQVAALNSYLGLNSYGNKRDLGTPRTTGSGLNVIYNLTNLNMCFRDSAATGL